MGWDAIHLTREELFEKVWSQPTRKLAEEYGISDVGLAKICKRLNILRRPQGFWARKYPPKPPALPPTKGPGLDDPVPRRAAQAQGQRHQKCC